MPEKRVCLAAYNCRCRPAGKMVDISTMKRHRKLANEKREKAGLNVLPRGPVFTTEVAHEQERLHNTFSSAFQNHSSPFIFMLPDGSSIPLGIDDYSPPLQHLQSHYASSHPVGEVSGLLRSSPAAARFVPDTNSNEGHPVMYPSERATIEDNESISMSAEAIQQRFADDDDDALLDIVSGSMVPPASNNFLPEDNLLLANLESQVVVRDNWRGDAYGNFMDWCSQNKSWVEMGVQFSLQNDVIDFVLRHLQSREYTSWITIKRNLFKYASLETTKYLSCTGHELLLKKNGFENVRGPHHCHPCTICSSLARGEIGKSSDFEYIRLRPRVRNWLSNERTFQMLYDQMQDKFTSRGNAGGSISFYEDFFDGALVKDIVRRRGGWRKCMYDLFLDVSTDGFNVFNSSQYDCWPIICMLHNLDPSQRFLIRNAIPIAFVKGPAEPKRLDTFLLPFIQEIRGMNMENGCEGARFLCADGIERCIKIHLVWLKGDGPASQKVGGFVGAKGRKMCRFCGLSGHLCPVCRSYYFPSKVRIPTEGLPQMRHLYDLSNLPMRNASDIRDTWAKLADTRMTETSRKRLVTNTGVKPRTCIYGLETIVPFRSFPLDIMHLTLNLVRSMMMPLWKAECKIGHERVQDEEFIISTESWDSIDAEMSAMGEGLSEDSFGRCVRERDTKSYQNWKAEECRWFICDYATVLLNGHLPRAYLSGVRILSNLLELAFRPTLTSEDVEMIGSLSHAFVSHYEERYFQFHEERVRLCKSTVHALLHLADNVLNCGPLILSSQFWMERYIGFVKNRLNATNNVTESLTQNAELLEAYKIFFGEHFVEKNVGNSLGDEGEQHGAVRSESIRSLSNPRFNMKLLLRLLASKLYPSLSDSEIAIATSNQAVETFASMRLCCNQHIITISCEKRSRSNKKRMDHFIASEYDAGQDARDVYYGAVSLFLRYTFHFPHGDETRNLFIGRWARGLRKDSLDEIYSLSPSASLFGNPTVELTSTITHAIGVLKHRISPQERTRTYFIDPERRVHHLLDPQRISPDGINRCLKLT